MDGHCNVHANGLCEAYREPTQYEVHAPLRRAGGDYSAAPRAQDWRASIRAASGQPVVAPVAIMPLVAELLDLF